MAIGNYIANLKERPEYVRKRHAFWWSFAITAVITVFWISSFGPAGITHKTSVVAAVEKAGTPAESLVAGVGDFASDIWSMIVGPKKVEYSEVEVTPGPSSR